MKKQNIFPSLLMLAVLWSPTLPIFWKLTKSWLLIGFLVACARVVGFVSPLPGVWACFVFGRFDWWPVLGVWFWFVFPLPGV